MHSRYNAWLLLRRRSKNIVKFAPCIDCDQYQCRHGINKFNYYYIVFSVIGVINYNQAFQWDIQFYNSFNFTVINIFIILMKHLRFP